MDLREKRTKRNIRNAFIQLRTQKPLERISVKELAELAEISKATFYLHYKDIYDLSDHLQKEVIQNVLKSLEQPEQFLTDNYAFTLSLFQAFHSQEHLIDVLFSGSQASILPLSIEKELKEHIFQVLPSARDDIQFNILLTYQIFGGYYAYQKYCKTHGIAYTAKVLETISKTPYPPLDS